MEIKAQAKDMSARALIATSAMSGILANPNAIFTSAVTARQALEMADALIEALTAKESK